MFNFLKKSEPTQNSSSAGSDPFAAFGVNKKMMVMALKQMRNLNPGQKQQIKVMFKKQVKRDLSRDEIEKGAEQLGIQLANEFSKEEIEQIKKDLIDLLS